MRRFVLLRYEDVTGVSGTGIIAHGVQYPDGTVAVRWPSEHPSTVVWDDVEHVKAIHGHSGRTVIRWIDKFDRDDEDM